MMKNMAVEYSQSKPILVLFLIFIVLFFLSQLPFLSADADAALANGSRGAWTDEGLYTMPVRNFINLGSEEFTSTDALRKTPYAIVTPLYSVYLFPFFTWMGIGIEKARIVTIFTCFAMLMIVFLLNRFLLSGIFFISIVLMLRPVHQYSTLCLAEIYCSLFILAGISLRFGYFSGHKIKGQAAMYFFLLAAGLFKVQYLYVLPIPLAIDGFLLIRNRSRERFRQFLFSLTVLLSLLTFMWMLWYLPFREYWELSGRSSSASFSLKDISIDLLLRNLDTYFLKKEYLLFSLSFLLSFLIFTYRAVKGLMDKSTIFLLIPVVVWMAFETHKLCLTYLPIRYLISFYVAMGFFMCTVFADLFTSRSFIIKIAPVMICLTLLAVNLRAYHVAWKTRSYSISSFNSYFADLTNARDVVLGPWAPSLTWQCKCAVYPVWAVYTNELDIQKVYRPTYIVSEPGQDDSGKAFSGNKMDLQLTADSLKQGSIALWKVNVYAMHR